MNEQLLMDSRATVSIAELENRVQARLCGRVRGLRILFQETGIVLRGFAPTFYAKQIAQHVIMGETTVPILANDIEVC